MINKQHLATVAIVVTSIIWGFGFVAQLIAMNYMDPFIFNALRFALGGFSLIPLVLLMEKGPINRSTVIAGITGGVVVFVASGLQQFGIVLTGSAGKSSFITGLYIILVPILGTLSGKKASRYVWAGAVLATGGIYLISGPTHLASLDLGTLLLMINAFCWAIHILVVDRFMGEDAKPVGFSMIQSFVCAGLSGVTALIFENPQMEDVVSGMMPLLYAGLVSVGVAYTLQMVGQKYISPGRSAIIFSMESVVGAVGEAVILGALLSPLGYAGGGLIFIGILVSQLDMFSKKAKTPGFSEKVQER